MSIDMYRRQATQFRTSIAKLMDQKARELKKAADAGKKSLTAQSAASKTSSTSTLQTKLRSFISAGMVRIKTNWFFKIAMVMQL